MSNVWTPDITKSDQPIYIALLGALERDIVSGALGPGDRLPTHRELATRLKLAIGTVTKAYREAERRGLIRGDGRRGTFVGKYATRTEVIIPSPDTQHGMIDMTPYHPPKHTDPDLTLALSRLAGSDIGYLIHYAGPTGYAHHRAAGARWVGNLGLTVGEDDITITAGAQHAILTTLIANTERDDIIATATHTYPGIKWASELLGLKLVGVENDSGGILPDAFEKCCLKHKPKFLYCIPTLQNPTCAVLSESRRRALAEIAEKHNVSIIEDEINRRLVDDPPPLISSIAPDRTYLVASLAKVVAGGLRTCYLVAPQAARENIHRAIIGTTLMVSPLLSELAAMWINDGTAERTVALKKAEAEKRNRLAMEILKDFDVASRPTSYFVWLTLPGHWRSDEFAAATRKRGVIVPPADIFAVDPSKAANAVRICIGADTTMESLKSGLEVVVSVAGGTPGPDSTVF